MPKQYRMPRRAAQAARRLRAVALAGAVLVVIVGILALTIATLPATGVAQSLTSSMTTVHPLAGGGTPLNKCPPSTVSC